MGAALRIVARKPTNMSVLHTRREYGTAMKSRRDTGMSDRRSPAGPPASRVIGQRQFRGNIAATAGRTGRRLPTAPRRKRWPTWASWRRRQSGRTYQGDFLRLGVWRGRRVQLVVRRDRGSKAIPPGESGSGRFRSGLASAETASSPMDADVRLLASRQRLSRAASQGDFRLYGLLTDSGRLYLKDGLRIPCAAAPIGNRRSRGEAQGHVRGHERGAAGALPQGLPVDWFSLIVDDTIA